MDEETKGPASLDEVTEEGLASASIEALAARLHRARRNAVLARSRADYQEVNNNHREAVLYERLVAANEKMAQAERKAIVESNPEVLKGRQQAIVHAKEAALWSAEAEVLRLYILARSRMGAAEAPGEGAGEGAL